MWRRVRGTQSSIHSSRSFPLNRVDCITFILGARATLPSVAWLPSILFTMPQRLLHEPCPVFVAVYDRSKIGNRRRTWGSSFRCCQCHVGEFRVGINDFYVCGKQSLRAIAGEQNKSHCFGLRLSIEFISKIYWKKYSYEGANMISWLSQTWSKLHCEFILENGLNPFGWQQGNFGMCHHHRIRHYRYYFFLLMYLWFITVLMIIIKNFRWTAVRVHGAHTYCYSFALSVIVYSGSTHVVRLSSTCCLRLLCSKPNHRFAPNLSLFLSRIKPIHLYHMLADCAAWAKEPKRYLQKFPTNKFDSIH